MHYTSGRLSSHVPHCHGRDTNHPGSLSQVIAYRVGRIVQCQVFMRVLGHLTLSLNQFITTHIPATGEQRVQLTAHNAQSARVLANPSAGKKHLARLAGDQSRVFAVRLQHVTSHRVPPGGSTNRLPPASNALIYPTVTVSAGQLANDETGPLLLDEVSHVVYPTASHRHILSM